MSTLNETKIRNALNDLSKLSVDEMLVVNKGLCQMIRQHRTVTRVAQTAKFAIGQIIRFHKSGRGRNAGTHFIEVEGFNRAGTALVGHEVDPKTGVKSGFIKWTVAPSVCTLHTLPAVK